MREGDIALFYADKHFYSAAVIAVPFVDVDKALELWDSDANGDTWELMFSFSRVEPIDLAVETFNAIVGYSPNKYVQGFSRLDDEKSEAVVHLLGLEAELDAPGTISFEDAGTILDGPMDKQVTTAARVEQRYLRRALMGGSATSTAQCALCGRTLPARMLVAAHIKPRSLCSEAEKKDIPSVAMLACTLGCDALFEHGYVTVGSDGAVQVSQTKLFAHDLAGHLLGRQCQIANGARKDYFAWHAQHRFA